MKLLWSILLFAAYETNAEQGIASWYGAECAGKKTASGEIFNPDGFSCASWFYPFGTRLRVIYDYRYRGRWFRRSVVVRVNDRGPAKRLGRIIDLSEASFAALENTRRGLIPVTIEKVQ